MALRALLLAAGHGTRLRPITDSVPKCLVDIDGRPLLDYWLQLLTVAGINDVVINLHYLADQVRAYLERCPYPLNVTTVYEDRLLGTAGTLRHNRALFGDDPVMLVHADNMSDFDIQSFIAAFQARPADVEMTMMTFVSDNPQTCGVVKVDDRGIVREFHEKVEDPPGNLANAAVYILAPTVVQFVSTLTKQGLDFSVDVLPHYIGRINTFHNAVLHRDIGTVGNLMEARRQVALRKMTGALGARRQ